MSLTTRQRLKVTVMGTRVKINKPTYQIFDINWSLYLNLNLSLKSLCLDTNYSFGGFI